MYKTRVSGGKNVPASTWEFSLFWRVIFQREASFGSLFVTVWLLASLLLPRHACCCIRPWSFVVCVTAVDSAVARLLLLLASRESVFYLAMNRFPSVAGTVADDPFLLAFLLIIASLLLMLWLLMLHFCCCWHHCSCCVHYCFWGSCFWWLPIFQYKLNLILLILT